MKKLKSDFSILIQRLLHLDGNPFSLENRDYLPIVYDHDRKKTILMFSRQAEKSTTLAAKIIGRSIFNKYFRSLYIAPRDMQVKEFSIEKIGQFLEGSPSVLQFQDKSSLKGRYKKTFTNGSVINLRSAYLSPDAVRGVTSDALFVDEFQDIIPDHLPVIESCMLHGKNWARFKDYAGTPKSIQNHIESEWSDSFKCEWGIKCFFCNRTNILGIKNIGREFLICSKCGSQIFPHHGSWVRTNKNGNFPGFRICYLMVPWVVWNDKKDPSNPGVIQMLEGWSETKFLNEVLAISSDCATNPITKEHILNACEDREMLMEPNEEYYRKYGIYKHLLVAGVDWGTSEEKKSKTVLTIGALCSDKKFRVIYMKKFKRAEIDPEGEVEEIAKTCQKFNVMKIAVDHGFGYLHNSKLNRFLPGKVMIMYLSHSIPLYITYNPITLLYTISRTLTITRMILTITEKNCLFFKYDSGNEQSSFEHYHKDFLSLFQEYDDKFRKIRYLHPRKIPDDALHSLNFAITASGVLNGDLSVPHSTQSLEFFKN